MKPSSENNPVHHTQKIKAQMRQLIEHLREDVGKVAEPKAQALFETSAEVLTGLVKAFDDYEKKIEAAWRTEPLASRLKKRTTHAPRR
jgi:F0F1-type ATP synthase membrane subunit b/b'